jgi:hypothetical protein
LTIATRIKARLITMPFILAVKPPQSQGGQRRTIVVRRDIEQTLLSRAIFFISASGSLQSFAILFKDHHRFLAA